MHFKRRLQFADNEKLRDYYREKYRQGGYANGYTLHGVDVSSLYHQARVAACRRLAAAAATDEVLDAGCGDGTLAAILAAGCRRVAAVDIADNAFAEAHRSIPNLAFHPMNIEELTFAADSFDLVVCVETLEHVLNPEKALRSIFRVLKPDGRFVLTYPTINRTLMKRLHLTMKVPISEHLTEWSLPEILHKAGTAGFSPVQTEGIAFDFGPLLALKFLSQKLALNLTRASIRLKGHPRNSMFVAVLFRKS